MVTIGIYGATGYAGHELIKILKRHPHTALGFLTSESNAGSRYCDVYPCTYEERLVSPDDADPAAVDVAFLCTPHAASAPIARRVLEAGARCVDLSADFRLRDLSAYETYYGPHPEPSLFGTAAYGLTEVHRDEVAGARLVANPGCYPTGPLLALYPFIKARLLTGSRVIIDAKSGVSGAGAKPSAKTHFVTVHDSFTPYNLGRVHRHVPEIEQHLQRFGQPALQIIFAPHLLPISRGIISTIYVSTDPSLDEAALRDSWQQAYAGEPFVRVLPAGELPSLAHANYTNYCFLGLCSAGLPGEWIVTSAIDNLVKGASGQAVQNMNVMFGLPEAAGLLP